MTTKRGAIVAFLMLVCLALPLFAKNAQTVTKGPIVTTDVHHDTGPLLREIAPLLPEYNLPAYHEIDNAENPNWKKWSQRPVQIDPVLQKAENLPTTNTPPPNLEFDALGYGQAFFCNCMPADNDGAPGTTQYTEFVNTFYAVYSKTGTLQLGPLGGNSFWSGFGGGCQADNWGDPMIRFDAAAQRWVAAQFDLGPSGGGPYAECVAVSTTTDATGSYNRYRFSFSAFPDYPKLGVWPDAYYWSYNINGSTEEVCATDRIAMLAGNPATQVCFTPSGQFGMLPADLDGATPPATGTPNFFMELDPSGASNLDMFKFHVDFVVPSNSTFTGPTVIPVPAFSPSCPGATRGACASQPDPGSDKLETLSDRLMYRLAYRNFGDHTVLLTSHTVTAGSSSGARWYEIRNPETTPSVFQSGTWAPDSQYRFMPSVAMDQTQDIAVGFTRSGSGTGQFPSLVYAGRVPSDPAGTLENEALMLAGTGSQSSGGFDRWGDYSSMTVDPVDDCTFWFTESYIKVTGQNSGFNWSTAIGNFKFPTCSSTPDFSLSANPTSLSLAQGTSGTSTITVLPTGGFTGSVTLSASGLPAGTTAAFSPNPTTSASTMTFTVGASTATGTYTVTVTGTSGSLTHTTTVTLTVTPAGSADFSLTASPSSVTVSQGSSSASTITVVPINGFSGSVTLSASGLPSGVTAAFSPNPTATTSTATFTASATATVGTVTVTVTGVAGSLTHSVSITLTVNPGATVTVTPASLTFTNTVIGKQSPAKTVTLKNTGTITLNITSITVTANFARTGGTCGSTLAAGSSCTVKVAFAPTSPGKLTGTLSFNDNAVGNPQTVSLSGTGVSLVLSPTLINFGVITVGSTSPTQNVTITNASSSTVTITSISLTGVNKGDFQITSNTCGSTLGGGSNCTVTLDFKPTAKGIRSASLSVVSNGGGSPQKVTLDGTGQ